MAERDYFAELSDEDLKHLTGPRNYPEPCVWCGGRLTHAELCVTKTDAFLPKLGFGKKYKKTPVRDVPPDYLRWALNTECNMPTVAMRAAIEFLRDSDHSWPEEIKRWEARLEKIEKR